MPLEEKYLVPIGEIKFLHDQYTSDFPIYFPTDPKMMSYKLQCYLQSCTKQSVYPSPNHTLRLQALTTLAEILRPAHLKVADFTERTSTEIRVEVVYTELWNAFIQDPLSRIYFLSLSLPILLSDIQFLVGDYLSSFDEPFNSLYQYL